MNEYLYIFSNAHRDSAVSHIMLITKHHTVANLFVLSGFDFLSEVRVFTGNGPEADLFVVLQDHVISTQRPVESKEIVTVYLEPGVTRETVERYYTRA